MSGKFNGSKYNKMPFLKSKRKKLSVVSPTKISDSVNRFLALQVPPTKGTIIFDVEQILDSIEATLLLNGSLHSKAKYGIKLRVDTKRAFPFFKRVNSIQAVVKWEF